MATIDTVLEHLLRMEREQKVRDEGLRVAFYNYSDVIQRMQQTIVDMVMAHRMPMEMGEFMTLMTTLLNRQKQLLELIGERVDDEAAWASEHASEGEGDLDGEPDDAQDGHIP